ncbi:MAG: flagellar assembly protein FliW [Treponema sp.]|jgi:flagellar assembly factor FliW|nr:flagellar assembly protein FliW [Treponema sp.]
MKVATKAYGLIDVDERQKIIFPRGLLGFEPLKDYVLLDAERKPFYWLQSIDNEKVAFILIDPFVFRPDYELNIDNEELRTIGISDPQNALIFAIVTIPPNDSGSDSRMTANLQGPLVINRDTRQAMQAVLTDPAWKTKHDIIAELEAANAAAKRK